MKFLHLSELRHKYWQELTATTGNFTNVLIALEVVNTLPIDIRTNGLAIHEAWATANEDAKNTIRDIWKEDSGFNVHEVLEMSRIIYYHRNYHCRTTSSALFVNTVSSDDIIGSEYEEHDYPHVARGRYLAEKALGAKMVSIHMYDGPQGSREFDVLLNDTINQFQELYTKAQFENTAREREVIAEVFSKVVHKYLYLIALANTFDFKGINKELVKIYLDDMFVKLTVPEDLKSTLTEACIALVG